MKNLNWYETLNKPLLTPPEWIFTPVWSILYVCMGISLFLLLKKDFKKEKILALVLFITQLGLNFLWGPMFFGYKNIFAALIIVLMLAVTLFSTILEFKKHSKIAAYLLIPYFLWVCFATYLNFGFWLEN